MTDKLMAAFDEMSPAEYDKYNRNLRKEETYKGMDIRICFPDKENLEMLPVYGSVPRKGDVLSISGWSLNPDEGYNYGFRRRWVVKDVIYIVRVQDRLKDRLLNSNGYSVEVYVKQQFDLSNYIPRFLLPLYYKFKYWGE